MSANPVEYWMLSPLESLVMDIRVWQCAFRRAFECHWFMLSMKHAAILQSSLKLSVSTLKGSKGIWGSAAQANLYLVLLILYWSKTTKI